MVGTRAEKTVKKGVTIPFADGEIAAIAFTNKLTFVTRNVNDFAVYDELLVQNWFTG